MNKILLSVLVLLSLAFAMVYATELDSTPIINDPTVDEAVEELGLFSEHDMEAEVPTVNLSDLPMFSYLENTNTVEADSQLDAEIDAEIRNVGISDAPLSFVEVDAEVDAEVEVDAEEEASPASLDNGNLPSKPEVIVDDCTSLPKDMKTSSEKEELLKLPTQIRESSASPTPYVNKTAIEEAKAAKPPVFPANATVIPVMVGPNVPVGKAVAPPSVYKFTPSTAFAEVDFKLRMDKAKYWSDPSNFQTDLLHDISASLSIPTRRLQIVKIDPQSLIVNLKIKQAGSQDFINTVATSPVAHAEALAVLFKNMHIKRRFKRNLKVLNNIDTAFNVKYTVSEATLPILAGLTAQLKIATDVRKTLKRLPAFVDRFIADVSAVTGVFDNQVKILSIKPWMGTSLHHVVVAFKITSRPDTLSDVEVNPMTALMRLKRSIRTPSSSLYQRRVLKGVDASFPLQRDLNNEPLVPYKSWSENPNEYQLAEYHRVDTMTHKPIVIPTLLVGSAVNETVPAPSKIAFEL